MSFVTIIFATLTALEFVYIFYLETIATTSSTTSRVFKMEESELSRKSVKTLFKNQGIYNLLIAGLILTALYIFPSTQWVALLMGYVVLVALYGGITSDKGIIFKQGGLAILTLISMLF
ncbi:DUF1304 domain-containing protein [Suipraeoptans intestinalis]|uniref:DUF1304 family protein n=1 Tax=Suipraeoptans intestinalis TaxID=2606628 RepID=A0A6N7UT33_9FIRM|nr:DUF1304 family protein [Suipraeoptans intestinalis]MDD7770284.1 DUF1304 family protein [Suipraeoptans intestinalis]MSR94188.1 DUF1304 family protein [Suipraeoptans intestinalis]